MASNDKKTEKMILSLEEEVKFLTGTMEAKTNGILHDVSLTKRILQEDFKKRATEQKEWLWEISEEVGTIEERTVRLEKKLCGPDNDLDASFSTRIQDIERTLDDMHTEMKIIQENLNIMAQNIVSICAVVKTKPKQRKRKKEDSE